MSAASDDRVPAKSLSKKVKTVSNMDSKGDLRPRGSALSAFASLPVDIMADIMTYLHSIDLLRLSLTSVALRSTLLTNPAIWRAARAREHLPDLQATDLLDVQYANLINNRACHCCGKKNIHKINHFFRARLCPSCSEKQYVFDDDRTFRKLFQSLHPLTLYCVMCDKSRRVGKKHWRFDTYFKPALLGMSAFLELNFPKPAQATHWHSRGGDDMRGDWSWVDDDEDEDLQSYLYTQSQSWRNRPTRTRRRIRYDEDGNLIRHRSPSPPPVKLTCHSKVQAFVASMRKNLAARAQDAIALAHWEMTYHKKPTKQADNAGRDHEEMS